MRCLCRNEPNLLTRTVARRSPLIALFANHSPYGWSVPTRFLESHRAFAADVEVMRGPIPGACVWIWAAALGAFLMTAHYYATSKSAFLDDSFIYLHVATNVVEHHSARCFLPASNTSLLATSPLRLYVLASAVAAVRPMIGSRTLPAARAAFIGFGVISCLAG